MPLQSQVWEGCSVGKKCSSLRVRGRQPCFPEKLPPVNLPSVVPWTTGIPSYSAPAKGQQYIAQYSSSLVRLSGTTQNGEASSRNNIDIIFPMTAVAPLARKLEITTKRWRKRNTEQTKEQRTWTSPMVWGIERHVCFLPDLDDRSLTVFWHRSLSSRLSLFRFNASWDRYILNRKKKRTLERAESLHFLTKSEHKPFSL